MIGTNPRGSVHTRVMTSFESGPPDPADWLESQTEYPGGQHSQVSVETHKFLVKNQDTISCWGEGKISVDFDRMRNVGRDPSRWSVLAGEEVGVPSSRKFNLYGPEGTIFGHITGVVEVPQKAADCSLQPVRIPSFHLVRVGDARGYRVFCPSKAEWFGVQGFAEPLEDNDYCPFCGRETPENNYYEHPDGWRACIDCYRESRWAYCLNCGEEIEDDV